MLLLQNGLWAAGGGASGRCGQKEHGKYCSLVNKYSSVDAELNQKLQGDRCLSFIFLKKIVERKRRDDFGQPSSS